MYQNDSVYITRTCDGPPVCTVFGLCNIACAITTNADLPRIAASSFTAAAPENFYLADVLVTLFNYLYPCSRQSHPQFCHEIIVSFRCSEHIISTVLHLEEEDVEEEEEECALFDPIKL